MGIGHIANPWIGKKMREKEADLDLNTTEGRNLFKSMATYYYSGRDYEAYRLDGADVCKRVYPSGSYASDGNCSGSRGHSVYRNGYYDWQYYYNGSIGFNSYYQEIIRRYSVAKVTGTYSVSFSGYRNSSMYCKWSLSYIGSGQFRAYDDAINNSFSFSIPCSSFVNGMSASVSGIYGNWGSAKAFSYSVSFRILTITLQ